MIYLDANASEPLRPEARDAAIAAMALTGNPSSIHGPGRAARQALETARHIVASRIGAAAADVVFCSGGTEANAMAIAALSPGRRILIGATEHDAVRAAAPGAAILPVLSDGRLDLDALLSELTGGGPALVCVMLANNETGVLHPVPAIAALCRAHGALLHVDAVQAAGRIAIDQAALGADTLALSGHKLGGPKGAGALVLAPDMHLPALAHAPMGPLRDALEAAAKAAGAIVCGAEPRLPNTTCLALPGVRAETQVIALDLAGIAVSAGAACSSGKVTSSHVLNAMGLADLAGSAIRVSLPWTVRQADIAAFSEAYAIMAARLLARR